jgi:hypothetical protein
MPDKQDLAEAGLAAEASDTALLIPCIRADMRCHQPRSRANNFHVKLVLTSSSTKPLTSLDLRS